VVISLCAANAGLGAMLARSESRGIAVAVVPVILLALASLIASNRSILIFAAIAINLLVPLPLTDALPLPGGVQVYPSDILVLLAVGSWVTAWLIGPKEARPSSLKTRILAWPLLLFAITMLAAIIRGHERYGQSLVSVPLRFVIYAGIAAAVTDLDARTAYRWLVAIFYAGTLYQAPLAIYGYATGTSVTSATQLSTGGVRVLAGSTAMFMAGALLLALLNLEFERRAGRTALHLTMAALATFALVSTFQRTTFAALGVLVPIFLLAFWRIGLRTAAFLPLVAPLLVIVALLISKADPTLYPTLVHRVTASPTTDKSAQWRLRAYEAVWRQIREAPIQGQGFGRPTRFVANDVTINVAQNPHNQFLYLWAGGGLLLFGSFILFLAVYLAESWRRFRRGTRIERRLIFWAVSLWFVFIVNSLTGIVLTEASLLLVFWVLLLLPMVVRIEDRTVPVPG
jgi:O-antigen ligase